MQNEIQQELDALIASAEALCHKILNPITSKVEHNFSVAVAAGKSPSVAHMESAIGDVSWITHNRNLRALLEFAYRTVEPENVWDTSSINARTAERIIAQFTANRHTMRNLLAIRYGA